MDKLKQSPAELLKKVQIKPIEQECLDRVFNYLSKTISFTHFYPYLLTINIVEKGMYNKKNGQVTA